MVSSEIENTEQKLAMIPAAAENGGNCGFIHNGSTKYAGGVSSLKLYLCRYGPFGVIIASVVVIVILIIIITILSILLSGRSGKVFPTTLPSPSTPTECCPDGWIGYQRKCYNFSDSDRNWTYSQNYCAAFNASLVVIDSQEEMNFLRRYKGSPDHWIGLQRTDDQEPWKWIDGTIFNNWFEIRGGGTCACLNHLGVASASRASEERWICSKPVGK